MAKAVNRMADTVVKDKNLVERQLEQQIYKYEQEKASKEQIEEEKRQLKKLKVNEDLRIALSQQLVEKNAAQRQEMKLNEFHMK